MHQHQRAFENIVGKGEIAHNEQFLFFQQCFLLNQTIVSPFFHIFDIISLFAAELKDPKIGIWGRGLMPFSTLFQLCHGGQCSCPCFPGVILISTPHNILSKPQAAFSHNHVKTMDSDERGMNCAAMTIINTWKEYWPSWVSNQRNPILKSCTLPTEL